MPWGINGQLLKPCYVVTHVHVDERRTDLDGVHVGSAPRGIVEEELGFLIIFFAVTERVR